VLDIRKKAVGARRYVLRKNGSFICKISGVMFQFRRRGTTRNSPGIQKPHSMVTILTDFQAAKSTTINLGAGAPPPVSNRKKDQGGPDRAKGPRHQDSIGQGTHRYPRNEEADAASLHESYLGQVAAATTIATYQSALQSSQARRQNKRATGRGEPSGIGNPCQPHLVQNGQRSSESMAVPHTPDRGTIMPQMRPPHRGRSTHSLPLPGTPTSQSLHRADNRMDRPGPPPVGSGGRGEGTMGRGRVLPSLHI